MIGSCYFVYHVIAGALRIKRKDLKILFKDSTKFNIYLQLRETSLRQSDDWDKELSFLVPILMDPKKPKVQVFVSGHKKRHNMICKNPYNLTKFQFKTFGFIGAFLKDAANQKGGASFKEREVQVILYFVFSTLYFDDQIQSTKLK